MFNSNNKCVRIGWLMLTEMEMDIFAIIKCCMQLNEIEVFTIFVVVVEKKLLLSFQVYDEIQWLQSNFFSLCCIPSGPLIHEKL